MHLNAHNTTFTLLSEERFRDVEEPQRFVLRSPGHERGWFRGCKGGRAAVAAFDSAGPLAEMVLPGNVAARFSRAFELDPPEMKVAADDAVDRALRRDHRQGWTL